MGKRDRRPPDRIPDVSVPIEQAVLVELSTQVGHMGGTMQQVHERVGELSDDVRRLGNQDNEHHQETSSRLSGIEARLEEGDAAFRRVEKQLDAHNLRLLALEGKRHGGGTSIDWLDKYLDLLKKWGPSLLAVLATGWAAFEKWIHKGGSQ